MAYRTDGVCFHQDGIAVTVLPYLLDFEEITRCFTLVPHLLPAAAVKPDILTGEGSLYGFLIHIAQHQHFTGIGILDYRRDKPFFIKL